MLSLGRRAIFAAANNDFNMVAYQRTMIKRFAGRAEECMRVAV